MNFAFKSFMATVFGFCLSACTTKTEIENFMLEEGLEVVTIHRSIHVYSVPEMVDDNPSLGLHPFGMERAEDVALHYDIGEVEAIYAMETRSAKEFFTPTSERFGIELQVISCDELAEILPTLKSTNSTTLISIQPENLELIVEAILADSQYNLMEDHRNKTGISVAAFIDFTSHGIRLVYGFY